MEVTPWIFTFALQYLKDVTVNSEIWPSSVKSDLYEVPLSFSEDLYFMINLRTEQGYGHIKFYYWFEFREKNLENFKMLADLTTALFCEEHATDSADDSPKCNIHFTECLMDFCIEIGVFADAADKEGIGNEAPIYALGCIVFALQWFESKGRFSYSSWQELREWACQKKRNIDALNPRGIPWDTSGSDSSTSSE